MTSSYEVQFDLEIKTIEQQASTITQLTSANTELLSVVNKLTSANTLLATIEVNTRPVV